MLSALAVMYLSVMKMGNGIFNVSINSSRYSVKSREASIYLVINKVTCEGK